MVKLSEDMIVARTRVSDLNQVKKLNCWGAELSDISVIRKLRNVEVLSLSVNSIATLSDIQNCSNLQELYIRKNCIPDISEVCYLRDLPRLKNLWLEENPCAEGDADLYRWTVLKNVPQLQKLDNVGVTSEEMAEAMRRGLELDHPLDGGSPNQSAQLQLGRRQHEVSPGPRGGQRGQESEQAYSQARKESVQSPSRRVSNAVWPEERQTANQSQCYPGEHEDSPPTSLDRRPAPVPRSDVSPSQGGQQYRGRERTPEEGLRRLNVRDEQQQQPGPPHRGQQRNSYSGPPSDYYRERQEYYQPVQQQVYSPSYDQQQHSIVEEHYEATYRQVDQQLEGAAQLVANRAISPKRPYPLRPKNRNSNVLSAILCLIKEIDGPSLEVVEMAVRCRMEELED